MEKKMFYARLVKKRNEKITPKDLRPTLMFDCYVFLCSPGKTTKKVAVWTPLNALRI